ncbi:uncharacterized protein BDV17DRAFT_288102 [Aspergillus undulatus]|uniref:uncharacterized protein n=1 Tax=Aspergillus undulatus TaxID=1810928 RepID=UPI003CCD061F
MQKDTETHVEDISETNPADTSSTTKQRPGYSPSSPEDERLDKRINLKMDLIVVPLLALGFRLQGIYKGNIGNAAAAKPMSRTAFPSFLQPTVLSCP